MAANHVSYKKMVTPRDGAASDLHVIRTAAVACSRSVDTWQVLFLEEIDDVTNTMFYVLNAVMLRNRGGGTTGKNKCFIDAHTQQTNSNILLSFT